MGIMTVFNSHTTTTTLLSAFRACTRQIFCSFHFFLETEHTPCLIQKTIMWHCRLKKSMAEETNNDLSPIFNQIKDYLYITTGSEHGFNLLSLISAVCVHVSDIYSRRYIYAREGFLFLVCNYISVARTGKYSLCCQTRSPVKKLRIWHALQYAFAYIICFVFMFVKTISSSSKSSTLHRKTANVS